MVGELDIIKARVVQWMHCHLRDCNICIATCEGKYIKYSIGNKLIKLPTEPGIYAIYSKADWMYTDSPVYIGETSNLRQRINYHFSESPSAKKGSTLKKALEKIKFKNKPTCDLVCFKYVKIPFGRKEIETLLHERYNINTKKK